MSVTNFAPLTAAIQAIPRTKRTGFTCGTSGNIIEVRGLSKTAKIGDFVEISTKSGQKMFGEVLSLAPNHISVLPEKGASGISMNDAVHHVGACDIYPDPSWLGRIIDPIARPLDNKPLIHGQQQRAIIGDPPPAASRRRLGHRLETGITAFNTFLPIVRGQRIGLFSGSGVGKSTLLANLINGLEADYAVLALVGERGREVREFVEDTLGPEGMQKACVVAATSDQSPMLRRRAAWTAMAVAEYLRDQGAHVLYLADSVTRFAEAHREIATASGETTTARGFPPSTAQNIMGLCERAGPGPENSGDITAVFSVLVSGSDMEEPIADIVRGVLDGHIVLDRTIAERGRFPAIDILASVSRSLPGAATDEENAIMSKARALISQFAEAELMIQAGLYTKGSVPELDAAIAARPKLEAFLSNTGGITIEESFNRLRGIVESVSLE